MPEVTLRSGILGLAMTVLFSAAAAYIALKLGQGIETAIPIAILAVGCSAWSAPSSSSGAPPRCWRTSRSRRSAPRPGIVVGGSVFVMPAIFVLQLEARSSFSQIFLVPFLGAVLGRHVPHPVPPLLRGRDARQAAVPRGHRDHRDPGHRREGRPAGLVLLGSMGIGFVLDYLAAGMEAWRDTFTTALIPACRHVHRPAQGGLHASTPPRR